MQPLTLHVQGLHSFRAPTRIDLARLGEHGLFGVFGPIGSGKSTLLDAITLALYGQVDRLQGRSRRGIVNNQSKRCEVRLRFLVGDAVWETQRAYRRLPDGNAQRIHSRLAQVIGRDIQVVADKEREVNARVERLLGLNAEDFMRAVVLPQGRFMQFLQLQGSDRRRMLQRIFHLEPFGEGLRHAVKRESTTVDHALQHVLGELEGLGGAGPEAVEAAEQAARAAATTAQDAREREQARAEALTEASRAHEHHHRLRQAQAELQRMQAEAPAREQRRRALAAARVARPLLALAGRLASATAQAERSALEAEDAQRAHDAAFQAQKQALAERARLLASEDDVEGLRARERELAVAVQAQEELAGLLDQLRRVGRQRATAARRHEEDQKALAELEREVEALGRQRAALRERLAKATVSNAERDRFTRAEQNRVALEQARERGAQLGDTLRQTRSELEQARADHDRVEQALRTGERRRERLRSDLQTLQRTEDELGPIRQPLQDLQRRGLVGRLEDAAARLDRARQERADRSSALDAARTLLEQTDAAALDPQALAGLLAQHLEAQSPCRVCGSVDHPRPAPPTAVDEVLASLDARSEALATCRALEHQMQAAEQTVQRLEAARAALLDQVPPSLRQVPPTELTARLDRLGHALTAIERRRSLLERQIAALAAPIDEARALVNRAVTRVDALARQDARDEAERHRWLEVEGRAWGAMTEALGDLTVFDLPRALREIQEKDAAREALEPELEALEQTLRQVGERREKRRTRADTHRQALADADARSREGEVRRSALLEQLGRPGIAGDPRQALQEVRDRIAARERALKQAQQAVEDTTRAALAATDARATLQATARSSTQRAEELRERLTEELATAGLAAVPAEEAGLPGVDLEASTRASDTWFQQLGALRISVDSLGAVDLPAVDDEALARAEEALREARRHARQAEQEQARSQERADQLRRRATRHEELAERRTSLSGRGSRLEELARLLRGDRFVEFVANDYLADLVSEATEHLALLTRGRYALDLDDQGTFLIADLDAGGTTRPASSLSGGETFLASLALALALSTQVQRHNHNALELFFLDEGFGSLDPESLDRVMTAIEALSAESRVIGLISHVAAVRERVPRRLELLCPRDGSGTQVRYREA